VSEIHFSCPGLVDNSSTGERLFGAHKPITPLFPMKPPATPPLHVLSPGQSAITDPEPTSAGRICSQEDTGYCWLSSYLLSTIEETTSRIPKILGFGPALEHAQLSYTETDTEYILHQSPDVSQLRQLAKLSLEHVCTVVSRLLLCEEALKEKKYLYSQLPKHFLIHQQLDQKSIQNLIDCSVSTKHGGHMKIPNDICNEKVLEDILTSERLDHIKMDDHFIIQGVLSHPAVRVILDSISLDAAFMDLVPYFVRINSPQNTW
jgi:hypothetical protein